MNCQETQLQFDNYLDHLLEDGMQAEFHHHLAECGQCREALSAEKQFRNMLAQLPVEPATPGFAARALRSARHSGRSTVLPFGSIALGAIAASFVLLFSFVVLFQGTPEESITVALLEEKQITFAFNSPQPIQHASFEIQLPEGIEIKGYPGQQMLAWNGSLKSGQNIMQLPIIVRSGEGGELKATIQHNEQRKSLSINIEVAEHNISQHPDNIFTNTTLNRG